MDLTDDFDGETVTGNEEHGSENSLPTLNRSVEDQQLSTDKCVSATICLICSNLIETDNQDVPDVLIHIKDIHLKQILQGLIEERKWRCFLCIVRARQEHYGSEEMITELVKDICMVSVIKDPKLWNNTSRLDNLINGLLDIGATIPDEGKDCIQACVECEHFEILLLLLSRGAHPKHLTIYPGDTPIHAAVKIALQTGHIGVFMLFVKKFKEDPEKSYICDPTLKDRNGDGLMHIVLCHPDDGNSRKMIELLIQYIASVSLAFSKNKKGQLPSDLIKDKHDQRWQLLKLVLSSIPVQPPRPNRKKIFRRAARQQKDDNSVVLINAWDKTEVPKTNVHIEAKQRPSSETERTVMNSPESDEKTKQLERAGETYRKISRPIEGSRCYEQLGHFNLAIETLCENEYYDMAIDTLWRYSKLLQALRSKGESVPAVLLDHAPGARRTREQLSHMAAEFHHRNGNEVRMMVNLERLEHLSDRINFLKKKGYFDQAGALLQKEGKYVDATQLYLLHGKTIEAVATARQSTHKDLIGECLVLAAQVRLRKKSENQLTDEEQQTQTDDVLQILQEAIDILLLTSNHELRGEACFLKGEITNEVTDINESWGAFNKCNPRCEAGQLECMDWMVRNSDLHSKQNRSQVVIGMENLFRVLNLLVSSDKAGGDSIFRYYGLKPVSDEFLKMYPQQKPRALIILKGCLRKADRKKTECEIARSVARDEICRFLLERGHYWYGEVTLALNRLKKEHEQCRQFTLGLKCTKNADGGKCSAQHNIMTDKALKSLLDIDLLHLEMDWYVQQGCGRLLKDINTDLIDMVNVFLPDTKHDHLARFKSCEVLLNHLMPRERFPFRMTEKSLQASRLHDYVCKIFNSKTRSSRDRKYLKEQMVCYLKAKYNFMKTKERKTNTDVFVKLYFLVNYFQLTSVETSKLMMEFETEVREEEIRKNPSKIKKRLEPMGFLVDDKQSQNVSVQCVARRFCEAYYQLTIPSDPLEALIKFTKFIVILGDRNKTAILPEFSDFLMWTEYFTTVAVCFGAKNNKVTNVFFLPASYLSLVNFIDTSFKTNGQPTFEIIQQHRSSWVKNLSLSQDRAERIIGVLCGSEIRLNLIRHLFKLREDRRMDFGLAERLLVLCMTILCNMGKALFANKEADLMEQLCLIALPDDCPPRLVKAVRAVQEAGGLSDIAAALKELLYDRDQEHVCHCSWSATDRFGCKSSPLQKLSIFRSTFFDPNTRKKMTNPGHDKVTTEEDEDAGRSSLAELDTDMTIEEKYKWENEQKMYEEDQKKKNAAFVITSFFKQIRFRRQCSILSILVVEELQKELSEKRLKKFQQFGIDEQACTICNVMFDKPAGNLIEGQSYAATVSSSFNASPGSDLTPKPSFASSMNPFTALFSNNEQDTSIEEVQQVSEMLQDTSENVNESGDNATEETAESWRAKKKLQHEHSLIHERNMTDFKQFKVTYKTQIAAKEEEILEFIRKHDLRTEGLKNYPDMTLDLTRLVDKSDMTQNEFDRILAKRDWGNSALLIQFFHEANAYFLRVQSYVEEKWKEQQEIKERRSESSKARNSQALHDENLDEEIQQLEDVVQEPVRQREKKGKGRGRGRGRTKQRQQDD